MTEIKDEERVIQLNLYDVHNQRCICVERRCVKPVPDGEYSSVFQ